MAHTLNLTPGDWVEVRTASEILATLDQEGCIDGLPFMPEMLAYCGRRFRVHKRADKTCDMSSENWGLRRMIDTVHLALLRCTGTAHGGCQAGCLLFWKEAWLQRVSPDDVAPMPATGGNEVRENRGPIATLYQLEQTACRPAPTGSSDTYYRCQATEVARATSRLPWWEPRQYLRDIRANGVSPLDVVRGLFVSTVNRVLKAFKLPTYPNVRGRLTRTPTQELNLQPGELVQIKSKEEILATLDGNGKNRGMTFDAEMIPYCGKQFRVLRRVERIINERTGQFMRLPNASIILNDVVCTARYHRFCPRGTFSFWREIWLQRVEPQPDHDATRQPLAREHASNEYVAREPAVGI